LRRVFEYATAGRRRIEDGPREKIKNVTGRRAGPDPFAPAEGDQTVARLRAFKGHRTGQGLAETSAYEKRFVPLNKGAPARQAHANVQERS
jgi:hypothetical protein